MKTPGMPFFIAGNFIKWIKDDGGAAAVFSNLPVMKQPHSLKYALLCALLLWSAVSDAQKRWIGASGNWDDALNWQPAALPDSTDQVILDNSSQVGDYTVMLPNHAIVVNTLIIEPAAGRQITVQLPATNMSSPAFAVRATGDALIIKNGGVFRNASGLSSGQSLQIGGMLRIENGGLYSHQTRSGHATDIVARLSTAAGTENGQFEFDVPGGSYPVSLSNRVYGKLLFSALASGGTQTYNASGTNPLLVRGDLVINNGVIINLDFTSDFTVMGNYLQEGGVFNIASQPAANKVSLQGDVNQLPAGVITETSTGLPVMELNGSKRQLVSLAGSLLNQLTLRINNTSGISLLHSLTVPYRLQLQQGNLFTTPAALLLVPDNSQVAGASVQSFVDGPVKKTGDEAFEFPVGKQRDYAPVALSAGTSVTDEFVAAYHHGNPQVVYGTAWEPAAIHHLSTLEYWSVERTAGSSSRKITLSVGTYSHATAIEKLVVSRWDAGLQRWQSEGNTAWSGLSTGTLTSSPVAIYGTFTLGSTIADQNPLLPVSMAHNKDPVYTGNTTAFFRLGQVSCPGGNILIHVFSRQRQSLHIVITTIDGRVVYNAGHKVTEGNSLVRCRLPVLAGGVLVVQVVDERGMVSVGRCLNRDL